MKIVLLRHEERENDVGFYSNLTENGIIKSCVLPKKLRKLNIDIIFSSPFIRTLQTVYKYALKYNKKINIEYGLYEYLHNPYLMLR
jgi:phosphohistidine phosphatase SixA